MWEKTSVSGSIGAELGYYITQIWAGLNLHVIHHPGSRILVFHGGRVIAVSFVSRMVLLISINCDVWWTRQSSRII